MAIDDFELETTDTGFEVTIEGKIPVVDAPRADHYPTTMMLAGRDN